MRVANLNVQLQVRLQVESPGPAGRGGGARAHDAQSLLIRKLTATGSENLAEFRFVFGLIFALRAPRVQAARAPEPGSAGLLRHSLSVPA